MSGCSRLGRSFWAAVLPLFLTLLLPAAPARAQGPPPQAVTVTRPASAANGLCGAIRVDVSLSAPPAGYNQGVTTCSIQDGVGGVYCQGACYPVTPTYQCFTLDSTTLNSAFYKAVVTTSLVSQSTGQSYPQNATNQPTFRIQNPGFYRTTSFTKLQGAFLRDPVSTGSSTSPLTGEQSFTVPVTSWDYKGATIPFSLEYDSLSTKDPQQPDAPNFSGLSIKNSHWAQPYAQWIDYYYADDVNALYAVWHHGNQTLPFQQLSSTTWQSPDPYHALTGDNVTATQNVTCVMNGQQTTMPVSAPDSSFTLVDGDETQYTFTLTPQPWQIQGCMALPYYLLTQILDRWGRRITVTWGSEPVGSGSEMRVTSVMDGGDPSIGQLPQGITLSYPNGDGTLGSVHDPQNRTHTLTYTAVPDEVSNLQKKLTSVLVYGPGDHTRAQYLWTFSYQDPNDGSNAAYGGKYTGDLVIHKTEPLGVTTNYFYEAVDLQGVNKLRLNEADWDGRIHTITWTDTDNSTKEIDRSLVSAPPVTMTFPGGVPVQYNDDSFNNTTSVTDVSTGRQWQYEYDTAPTTNPTEYHNLTTVRTPVESNPGTNPLVKYQYNYNAATWQINSVVETVLQSDGSLGDKITTSFDNFNLPSQIVAQSRDGMHNQTTNFHYDNDATLVLGSSPGNLTKLEEAVGQPEYQFTSFTYMGAGGPWGLPDSVTNEVGGMSGFVYDPPSGRLAMASSPPNKLVATTNADYPPSTTVLGYNTDGLPNSVADPMMHTVTVGYDAVAAGSANLKVTLTYPPYGNTRQFIVDARGRIVQDQDEAGIQTVWAYNNEDQVTSVTRAANQTDPRTTSFVYTAQGDLDHFVPPNGAAGTVYFEYGRYNLVNNVPVPSNPSIYEGQVTRIRYPDNTSEYFGYNNAAELAWRVKGDGGVINITRDPLHRISQISYPSEPGVSPNPAIGPFNVTAGYDEFGRITSTADQQGPTTLSYDNLNRLMSVTPPAPQRAVTYSYLPDTTLNRWTTKVSVANTGSTAYQYQEDSKGRLAGVLSPLNQQTNLFYDPDGKNIEADLPNGVKEYRSYLEPQDWLSGIQIKQPNNSTLDQLTYYYTDAQGNYDPTGHLRREADNAGRVHAFFYDHVYQLSQETHPDFGTPGSISYSYDLNGNRLTRNLNGTALDYYGYDNNNKLLWVNRGTNAVPTSGQTNPYMLFGYDANGNTTSRERRYDGGLFHSFALDWDGDDNLRHVYQQGALWMLAFYNGDGLRVKKQDFWTPWHDYTWGLGGVLVDSSDGGNGVNNTIVYTPGVSQNVNGTDQYFDTDWLGSTRYLTDSTGNNAPAQLRYDAFGEVAYTNPTNFDPSDYQWAGSDWGYQAEWSASYEPGIGLQYLRTRYYDPATGRFVSPDRLGYDAGLNLFGYDDNDPVNGTDPLGLQGLEDYEPPARLGQELGQGFRQFKASPELKPGSKERVSYSNFLDTLPVIGQAKQAWQALTGYNAVAGRRLSGRERVGTLALLAIFAAIHVGGEGETPSFGGLSGKDFEAALNELYETEPFTVNLSTGERVEFDGLVSATEWYEAKSAGNWPRLLGNAKAYSQFQSDIGEQVKAAREHGVSFRLITNAVIPAPIREWLVKKGVGITELLH